MDFSVKEKQEIHQALQFLIQKGYRITDENGDRICVSNSIMQFSIANTRYYDPVSISMKFLKENYTVDIGLIQYTTCHKAGMKIENSMETAVGLLEFVKKNYEHLMDIDFCRKEEDYEDAELNAIRIKTLQEKNIPQHIIDLIFHSE